MPCSWIKLPDGTVAIVKHTGRHKPKPCSVCGRPGGLLCDFPVGKGKTCSKPLCVVCRVAIGPETDYCPDHPRRPKL